MSIIQSIRDKAAWLVFILIGLSLLGFILMDGGKRMGMGGPDTTVGSVNGTKLEYANFQAKVKQMEDQYQQQGYPMSEQMRQTVQEQTWQQFVQETLLDEEMTRLGITVTTKEVDDILFGANPPQDLRQQFSTPDGRYDANAAKNYISQLRSSKDPRAMQEAEQLDKVVLPSMMKNKRIEKYATLMGSAYVPKWLIEKTNTDNSQMAAISYVQTPYSTISDSTVKVTDDDIKAYVAKHKDEFKQEDNRGIAYVLFNALPTTADSSELYNQVVALRTEFASTTDVASFLARSGSNTNFYDGFVVKSKMQMPNADTIRGLADGSVYGPYTDGSSYVLAKMIGKRTMPDSVKCRHILIATADRNGNQILPDSIAKVRIDSIATAIKSGANFAQLCEHYSNDPGSKDKGGEYDFGSQQYGNLAKEFAETVFYGSTGDKKVVHTSFGYHYIEVLNQKGFEPAYKVAYLSKPIIPSAQTENAMSGLASQLSAASHNKVQDFDNEIKKFNYNKLIATDIKPTDNNVMGIGSSRQLVHWVNDAKIGDVSEPFNIDEKYVVVTLTEINKEGEMSPAKARPMVEMVIRNQKKAEQIKTKIGKATTLEAVAAATQQQVFTADSVSFAAPFIANVGQEPKVIGASFNKGSKDKISTPIAGNSGVFVIKVNNITAQPTGEINFVQQQQAMQQQARQQGPSQAIEALKKEANIKDNRAKIM